MFKRLAHQQGVGPGAACRRQLHGLSCPVATTSAVGAEAQSDESSQSGRDCLKILLVENHADTAKLMRRLLARASVPAIALSGYGTPSDIEKSRAAGFAEHLVKPLHSVVLLTAAIAPLGVGAEGQTGHKRGISGGIRPDRPAVQAGEAGAMQAAMAWARRSPLMGLLR